MISVSDNVCLYVCFVVAFNVAVVFLLLFKVKHTQRLSGDCVGNDERLGEKKMVKELYYVL